jgi:hypothetical protein
MRCQIELTIECHMQPGEPVTQNLKVRLSEGVKSEVCKTNRDRHMSLSSVSHAICAVYAAQRLQDSKLDSRFLIDAPT